MVLVRCRKNHGIGLWCLRLSLFLLSPVFFNCHVARAQSLIWSDASNLTDYLEWSTNRSIALSSEGTKATAVWSRRLSDTEGSYSELVSASATIDGNVSSWGNYNILSVGGMSPTVALSSDGTKATVIWSDFDQRTYNSTLYSASATIIDNSASWGAISILASAPGGLGAGIQLALSSDGTKATATWVYTNPGPGGTVQSASATINGNSASWGPTINLSPFGLKVLEVGPTSLWLSPDGTRATALWAGKLDYSASETFIQSASASISGSSASWGAISDLSTDVEDFGNLKTYLLAEGTKATALWTSHSPSIKKSEASINGNFATWSSVTELSAPWQSFNDPQLSFSSDGTKVTAVWYDKIDTGEIFRSASATLIENTAFWGSTADLSTAWQTTITHNHQVPRILLSSDGTRATAVWVRRTGWYPAGGGSIVQSASAKVTGNYATWSPAIDLSASDQYADYPQVSVSSDGVYAIAIWSPADSGTGLSLPYDKRIIQSAVGMADDEQVDDSIVICHVPPGNLSKAHTLNTTLAALNSHLEHGDYRGVCNVVPLVPIATPVSTSAPDINAMPLPTSTPNSDDSVGGRENKKRKCAAKKSSTAKKRCWKRLRKEKARERSFSH